MQDEEFLALPVAEARAAAKAAIGVERQRLILLYANRHNVNLESSSSGASEAGVTDQFAVIGWVLIAGGAGAALLSFFYNVGVETSGLYGAPQSVVNLDKVAVRNMILACGLAAFVAGWIALAASHVSRQLRLSVSG